MKARSTSPTQPTRFSRWSAALSWLVVLLLAVPPQQMCLLMETAPGHAGSAHHAHSGTPGHVHEHEEHGDGAHLHAEHGHAGHHHDSGQNASETHEAATASHEQFAIVGAALDAPTKAHACCSDDDTSPAIATTPQRASASDESSLGLSFVSALPLAHADIFALTASHGRDGPRSDLALSSQFFFSPLSGRAPPATI